ncbi:hypothetical protein K438DRAFT_239112 [Mycena galopus ATCC 62051]|nr:hypothetical protein K438DRAFT_239112 [Mycena galopus ATCC 62051]
MTQDLLYPKVQSAFAAADCALQRGRQGMRGLRQAALLSLLLHQLLISLASASSASSVLSTTTTPTTTTDDRQDNLVPAHRAPRLLHFPSHLLIPILYTLAFLPRALPEPARSLLDPGFGALSPSSLPTPHPPRRAPRPRRQRASSAASISSPSGLPGFGTRPEPCIAGSPPWSSPPTLLACRRREAGTRARRCTRSCSRSILRSQAPTLKPRIEGETPRMHSLLNHLAMFYLLYGLLLTCLHDPFPVLFLLSVLSPSFAYKIP